MATPLKLNHFAIPYLAILIFVFGGIITNDGIAWYYSLALPAWNPSMELVAVIWAIIYVGAAASLLLIWNTLARTARFNWILSGFVFCTLLNAVWSILFFHFHLVGAALVSAVILELCSFALIALTYTASKKAALLLVPYSAWVLFAIYLQYVVLTLNS